MALNVGPELIQRLGRENRGIVCQEANISDSILHLTSPFYPAFVKEDYVAVGQWNHHMKEVCHLVWVVDIEIALYDAVNRLLEDIPCGMAYRFSFR
jgi:hypothetical protein